MIRFTKRHVGWFLAAATPALASDIVTLINGRQIHAHHVELLEDTARLSMGAGTLEIPRTKIASIEEGTNAQAVPAAPQIGAVYGEHESREESPVVVASKLEGRSPGELLREAAQRYGLPPALLHSVAKTESNIRQDAVSPKGAIGVMQLMPETAARFSADPADIEQNVDAGARYLRDLLLRYDGSAYKALAAYNAGETAVDRYNGIPPYEETQNYVRLVLGRYQRSSAVGSPAAEAK